LLEEGDEGEKVSAHKILLVNSEARFLRENGLLNGMLILLNGR
jgi:hypothetical protein